jgi:hypothetical protein
MKKSIFASVLFMFGAIGLIKLDGNVLEATAKDDRATELDTDDHGKGCCCSSCGSHMEHKYPN